MYDHNGFQFENQTKTWLTKWFIVERPYYHRSHIVEVGYLSTTAFVRVALNQGFHVGMHIGHLEHIKLARQGLVR